MTGASKHETENHVRSVAILPEEGFVDLKQIIGDKKKNIPGVLPISKATWFKKVITGEYPSGIKHGGRTLYPVQKIRKLLEDINATA